MRRIPADRAWTAARKFPAEVREDVRLLWLEAYRAGRRSVRSSVVMREYHANKRRLASERTQ